MTRPVSLGFMTIPPGSLAEDRWRITPSGMEPLANVHEVPNWQYTTDLLIERSFTGDVESLRQIAGLGPADDLRACLTWQASSTGLQGSSPTVQLAGVSHSLSMLIPGVETGGSLRLRLIIAAGLKSRKGRHDLAARHSGSILHADGISVDLEGESSRFPTEALSFSATGIADPASAWSLHVDTLDLDASILSSVRLILNTDSEVHERLTERPDSEEAEVTRRFMSYDVARQLVIAALSETELMPVDYESGTLGHVLRSRLRDYFGEEGDAIEPLRARWRSHPSEIDGELQRFFKL